MKRCLVLVLTLLSLSACVSTGERPATNPECTVAACGPKPSLDDMVRYDIPRPLLLTPFGDGKYWLVREPFELSFEKNVAIVPVGFVTDLASVPRPFWTLLPKWDGYGGPSIVHDFLYSSQHTTRLKADEFFLSGMEQMNVGVVKRHTIFTVLRLFGGFAWASHQRRKLKGLNSCLSFETIEKFTPRTTWREIEKKAIPCEKNVGARFHRLIPTMPN